VTQRGPAVRLDFRSTFDVLDIAQVISDHLARMVGLDEDAQHWVSVAVRESIINAVKHGNCHDTTKRVFVEFTPLESPDPPGVAIRVRDEGCGFDPSTLSNPLAEENLLKSSGRGIFLIRCFMDEMILRPAPEGGMEMVMVKHAQPKPV
jgi:serine/threonine-protein kinase RsbW